MTDRPASLLATRRGKLLLLCAVQFLDVVDSPIMNVALPSIRRDLGFSAQAALSSAPHRRHQVRMSSRDGAVCRVRAC